MKDLIEALTIFSKYISEDNHNPTNCEHDALYIMEAHRGDVSGEDHLRLEELDFFWDDDEEVYMSFRFGSA